MRLPKRSWVTSRGTLRSARRECSRASAEPRDRAEVANAVDAPAAALALERLLQREVGVEGVVGLQRRRLVQDLVRALDDGHPTQY